MSAKPAVTQTQKTPHEKVPLGRILLERKLISEAVLEKVLLLQKKQSEATGKPVRLGDILKQRKIVPEKDLVEALRAQRSGRNEVLKTRAEIEELHGVLTYVRSNEATGDEFVAQSYQDDILVAEASSGKNLYVLATPRIQKVNLNTIMTVADRAAKAYADGRTRPPKPTIVYVTPDVIQLYRQSQRVVTDDVKTELEEEFEKLLKTAYEKKAVDLHFFREVEDCRVRMRIWGALRDHEEWTPEKADDILSVGFSTFGKGAKYTHWKPNIRQRARIKIRYSNNITLDCRYEHAPGDEGAYHACIRILANDRRDVRKPIDLTSLGFTNAQRDMLEAASSSASGLILLSGPTGSGKSTTLAGLVKYINRNDDTNVLTVESPIERTLPAFQTSVSDDDNADPKEFAHSIRSCLRRDPSVLLVGEIRDELSASAAATGVQTGHILLSTVHAQSAIEIVERLSSPAMQLPPGTIGSPSFIAALAFQKLLPTMDPETKKRITEANAHEHLSEKELKRLKAVVPNLDKFNICVRGTSRQNPEGISGMTICAEVVVPDDKLRRLFREMELTDALNYWRELGTEEHGDAPVDERVTGLTAADHALSKMLAGLIDPRDVEGAFGHLNLMAKTCRATSWRQTQPIETVERGAA